MRAQFAGRPKFGFKAPRENLAGDPSRRDRLREFWTDFRAHSLFISLCAYYVMILGTLYLPVGSKLMLGSFIVTVVTFVAAVLARFDNGWRLVLIAFIQGALVIGGVKGLEAMGVTGLSEIVLIQLTIPLPLAYAWGVDRDEHDLDLLERPLAQ